MKQHDTNIKNWRKISDSSEEMDVYIHKNGDMWVDVLKLDLPDFMLKIMGEATALRHMLKAKDK